MSTLSSRGSPPPGTLVWSWRQTADPQVMWLLEASSGSSGPSSPLVAVTVVEYTTYMNLPRCPYCATPATAVAPGILGPQQERSRYARLSRIDDDGAIFCCTNGHRWGDRDGWAEHLASLDDLSAPVEIDRDVLGAMLPAMVTRWPTEGIRDPWADVRRWDTLDPGKRWLVAGSPPLVLFAIADSGEITISLPVVSWTSPHRTSLGAESEVIFAPDRDGALADRLAPAIERVIATRLSSFTPCAECQSVNPPEWMHDRRICQGCAERNHGVVH